MGDTLVTEKNIFEVESKQNRLIILHGQPYYQGSKEPYFEGSERLHSYTLKGSQEPLLEGSSCTSVICKS